MIKKIKIYSDLNDEKTYAYCTYELHRDHGNHIESFRIDLLFTDNVTGKGDFKAGMPVYHVIMTQSVLSTQPSTRGRPEPIVFNFTSYAYDQHTILDLIGDCPEHRDFLAQVGIHE